jgi:hypothetical protein
MNTQAMNNISIDFADFDFIQFKYGGVMRELSGIKEDFLTYIDNFQEDWSRQDVLDMYLMEDIAAPFIEDTFKNLADLLSKTKIVD